MVPHSHAKQPGEPEASLPMLGLRSLVNKNPQAEELFAAIGALQNERDVNARIAACHQLGHLKATAGLVILCEIGLVDRDRRVVEATISALRGTEDPIVVDKLKSMIMAFNGALALPAATVLRGTKHEPTILWLANEVREPRCEFNAPLRKKALIYALGETTYPTAIRALLHCAEKSKIPSFQAEVILALKGCQDSDVILWICKKGLLNKQDCIREASAAALQGTNEETVIDWLLTKGVSHSERPVRLASISALAGTTNPRAVQVLFKILGQAEQDYPAATEAMRALKQTNSSEVVSLLCSQGLTSDCALTRRLAAQALKNTADGSALKALFKLAASDPNHGVCCEAINAIAGAGLNLPEASVLWENCLTDVNDEVRLAAVTALTGTKHAEALRVLCEVGIGEFRNARLTIAAARALMGTEDQNTLEWLTKVGLASHSDKVREAAAYALMGTTYGPALRELAQTTIKDEYPNVRAAAARALSFVELPEAKEALCAFGLKDKDAYVRENSIWALQGCREKEIIAALFEVASFDTDSIVQSAARRVLGTVPTWKVQPGWQAEEY